MKELKPGQQVFVVVNVETHGMPTKGVGIVPAKVVNQDSLYTCNVLLDTAGFSIVSNVHSDQIFSNCKEAADKIVIQLASNVSSIRVPNSDTSKTDKFENEDYLPLDLSYEERNAIKQAAAKRKEDEMD